MHISETTVRRPVLAAVISMFLVLLVLVSYDKLSIREYPDIDKPVVTVSTIYLGASAEIVERDITQILEDSLSGISDIKEIKSEIVILKKSLMNLKFQKSTGQLEKTSEIKNVRHKISRLKTQIVKINGKNNA